VLPVVLCKEGVQPTDVDSINSITLIYTVTAVVAQEIIYAGAEVRVVQVEEEVALSKSKIFNLIL